MRLETIERAGFTPALDLYGHDDLQAWVGQFLCACRSRNLATGTVEFYRKKLTAFVKFCSALAISNTQEITPETIRQFLIHLDENRHKAAGIHCYYWSVKTFLNWYEREAEPSGWRNPIKKVKAPIVPLARWILSAFRRSKPSWTHATEDAFRMPATEQPYWYFWIPVSDWRSFWN